MFLETGNQNYEFARCHLAVSRRKLFHHGVLAAAACWVRPLLALGENRHLLVNGNGDNSISNGDNAPPVSPVLPDSSNNWEDYASALQGISREQFANALGTDFKITFSDGTQSPVWLTLSAVGDLPTQAPVNAASFAVPKPQTSTAPGTNGYMLTFVSTAQITQGAYLFEHATLGKFALFTVPDGQTGYNAVVNLLSAPTIIAVPVRASVGSGNSGGNIVKITPTGAVTASPATSSETDSPSPRLFGTLGVRKGALRD